MIRETGYHKYKNRAGKDTPYLLYFLSAIFFTYLYPTRKNTIYYKYTKVHLIYIQKQFVSI